MSLLPSFRQQVLSSDIHIDLTEDQFWRMSGAKPQGVDVPTLNLLIIHPGTCMLRSLFSKLNNRSNTKRQEFYKQNTQAGDYTSQQM